MTNRGAKRKACLLAWELIDAAMCGDLLLPYVDDDGNLTPDGKRLEAAMWDLAEELYRRAGDEAQKRVERLRAPVPEMTEMAPKGDDA